MTLRERVRKIAERWFLSEPLLFAAWSTHRLEPNPRVSTLRIASGRVEYNPAFLDALDDRALRALLTAEALRIVLKHPYARRKPSVEAAWLASNITLAESLGDPLLPFPRAVEVFGTHEHDRAWFERYYALLTGGAIARQPGAPSGGPGDAGDGAADGAGSEAEGAEADGGGSAAPTPLQQHAQDAGNAQAWDHDDLLRERIDGMIHLAESSRQWGTIGGHLREQILATLKVKLDYRAVLRQFRMSVLSQTRVRTRMKPSRRYGFEQLGSRRDFTTRLLVAIDVSGSMSNKDIATGFSIINRFFRYGVEAIDVVQFDTELQGPVESLRKARREVTARGRGGTDFRPVITWIDEHPGYDGLIIFTDGVAPAPPRPRTTRALWLFTNETTWEQMHKALERVGRSAFVKES